MTEHVPPGDREAAIDPDYRATFDAATDCVTEELLRVVADARGVDPTELRRIASVLDPDALDALFRSYTARDRPGPVSVSFEYEGHHVVAMSTGTIALEALGE